MTKYYVFVGFFKGMICILKPIDFMVKIQQFKLIVLHKEKHPHKNNMHQQIMELLQINTLAMSYNIHFVIYNTNNEHVF